MDTLIIDLIERGGYFGIFLLMALENIIPPVPSEVIMGIGGLLVERGAMDFWPLLLIGTAGTTAGNYWWYWLGDKLGYKRLRPLIDRWGRWLTVDWEHIEQAQRFFVRRGHWVIFFLRFSPFLRTIISLPAGLAHMPLGKFLAYTFAGSLIWNALLILGGQLLAAWLADSQDVIGWIIIAMVVLAVAAYVWRFFTWKPRAERD
ncbi:DedA family protein [Aurantiacibacter gangjinensis]|uniref:Alkaline phosphatase n=1 Tax=Aurantiacibacter gangjinensis TaxID=502682 RepID=A0A0G9MU72_9SPHN|nr:DedA family protein [Aurantiacibacter gangjinensis]APE28742.1 DedA [Aurantiacibacter gangjinensis]KLE32898.1 alkaline phosphatase [Aurantiacibacter gangjinensis]